MQIQRTNNYSNANKQTFGRIWGAERAIKALENRGLKIQATQLRNILPQAQSDSEGVEMYFAHMRDSGSDFLDVRVSKKIDDDLELFGQKFSEMSPKDQEDFMHMHFTSFSSNKMRAPGNINLNQVSPREFGKEVLGYVIDYKRFYLDWAEKNNI